MFLVSIVNKELKDIDKELSLVSEESIAILSNLCADRNNFRRLVDTACLYEDGADV